MCNNFKLKITIVLIVLCKQDEKCPEVSLILCIYSILIIITDLY